MLTDRCGAEKVVENVVEKVVGKVVEKAELGVVVRMRGRVE